MSPDLVSRVNARLPEICKHLGMRMLEVTPTLVRAEMEIRPDLCGHGDIAYGGVLMSLADALGGIGAYLNVPPGAATTTLESKTNFFAPAPSGSIVIGTAERLHAGRRTSVWQTHIRNAEGRLLALVVQTQMVIEPWRSRA